jgi:hypothetical protein
MSPGNDNSEERSEKEWEKCLESTQNFDSILIDLRKYGFTFISVLIGSEVFFGLALGIQNAILLTIATITVVIYWLDLYYRNGLSGSLLRSIFLEMFRLEAGLTYTVSSLYAKTKSEYYIVLLYGGLFVTSIFIAATLNSLVPSGQVLGNSTQLVTNSKELAANSKQLAAKSVELAPNLTRLTANLTQLAAHLTQLAGNSTQQAGNSTNILSNVQINAIKLSSKDIYDIANDLYLTIVKPFVLTILIVGIGFILTMYLTSRKRRRTFSQMLKVYDYCYTLTYESALPDIYTDIQRVVMKILQEKERARYMFSLPIGYPRKMPLQLERGDGTTFIINKGDDGTLFLAERKAKRIRITENRPIHYWLLISHIGIVMLNTIGTFDRHQRPEVYYFARYGEKEKDLKKRLEEKKIVPEHCEIITKLYKKYESEAASNL